MFTCTYISIIIDLLINYLMTHKVTHQQPPSSEPAQPVWLPWQPTCRSPTISGLNLLSLLLQKKIE